MRPILAKHIFGHCSYNFAPEINQIGTQYVYNHVINMDVYTCDLRSLISRLGSLTGRYTNVRGDLGRNNLHNDYIGEGKGYKKGN